jgi:hypothetical protein
VGFFFVFFFSDRICHFCWGGPSAMILLLMAPMQLELQTCTTSLFIEIGSHKFFAWTGLKLWSPMFCFTSSWDSSGGFSKQFDALRCSSHRDFSPIARGHLNSDNNLSEQGFFSRA